MISCGHEIFCLEDSLSSPNPLVSGKIQKSVGNFGTGWTWNVRDNLHILNRRRKIFCGYGFLLFELLLWQMDELATCFASSSRFKLISYVFTTWISGRVRTFSKALAKDIQMYTPQELCKSNICTDVSYTILLYLYVCVHPIGNQITVLMWFYLFFILLLSLIYCVAMIQN